MIIQNKQPKARSLINLLLTVLGWIFLLFFFYNFLSFFTPIPSFYIKNLSLSSGNVIVTFTLVFIMLIAALLQFWGIFNKKKYGYLTRRKTPPPATTKEIADYFDLSEEEVKQLQIKRYIVR